MPGGTITIGLILVDGKHPQKRLDKAVVKIIGNMTQGEGVRNIGVARSNANCRMLGNRNVFPIDVQANLS